MELCEIQSMTPHWPKMKGHTSLPSLTPFSGVGGTCPGIATPLDGILSPATLSELYFPSSNPGGHQKLSRDKLSQLPEAHKILYKAD